MMSVSLAIWVCITAWNKPINRIFAHQISSCRLALRRNHENRTLFGLRAKHQIWLWNCSPKPRSHPAFFFQKLSKNEHQAFIFGQFFISVNNNKNASKPFSYSCLCFGMILSLSLLLPNTRRFFVFSEYSAAE
jgi:hypothetical protein